MRYLNPKADLTFKRVFGEHPDLVMSLLNALLPLLPGEEITDIEYLPVELVPENPLRKNSIVDVRCRDRKGRQFIVEMQMVWSPEFQQRVLFNASKAYVRQVGIGDEYKLLQPVYSLNLVNEVFEPELEGYYHYYRMVHVEHSDRVIEGLQLIFVELPKFNPHTFTEKKMQALWLRYLTEIDDRTREVPADLLTNPDIKKAVDALEESAFTDAQLLGYEKFWDIISVEKTLYGSGFRKGVEEGREAGIEEGRMEGIKQGIKQGVEQGIKQGIEQGIKEGIEQGIEQGKAEGIREGIKQGELEMKRQIAANLKKAGISTDIIAQNTGLTEEDIRALN